MAAAGVDDGAGHVREWVHGALQIGQHAFCAQDAMEGIRIAIDAAAADHIRCNLGSVFFHKRRERPRTKTIALTVWKARVKVETCGVAGKRAPGC